MLDLTRSASLSEKELKEARVRSQIIAAQLTVPSGCSNSRGVQLFNRRKKRVNAFTLDSCGERRREEEREEREAREGDNRNNNLTWEEEKRGPSEGTETDGQLNWKNSIGIKPPLWSPPSGSEVTGSDIMEDPGNEHIYKEVDVIQERHFQPVNERQGEAEERSGEREREEIYEDIEGEVKDEIIRVNDNNTGPVREEVGMNRGSYTYPTAPPETHNGFHSTQGSAGEIKNGGPVSMSLSRQTPTIVNRTARPFFSPPTVQPKSPEARSPVMDNNILPAPSYPTPTLPPAPSYSTPPLPPFTATRPVAFSPPPPPPSYSMPPLPAFPIHPPPPSQSLSSPPPMSTVMFPRSTPVPQYNPPPTAAPVPQYLPPNPPVTRYIPPPTSPRPNTFVPFTPQPIGQQNQQQPIKTGILEEGAAAIRRSSTARKSMFTFKEKPVMAPNPELLSLVQGNDDRKKHGLRSVPDPAPEEELLALGAEASNFLAREELKAEAAKVPEWSSCLKSSRTREPRGQHQPEQTLTNASGKGAELFAKRQSRMEKYVVENQNVSGGGGGQMRSPSPTASLPPSWVYPSNMPGRVKAIANNTDLSARLTQTLQTPQPGNRRPSQQAPTPAPVPEEPPLENGCTKIEMDLSRHQPYQLNSSLFIFNPVQDSTSTLLSALPRGAPPTPKPLVSSEAYSRQASLPSSNPPSHNYNSLPRFRPTQSPSLQPPSGGIGGGDYYPPQHGGTPQLRDPRITSPVSAFSPERVASPRSGVQAPRPTFSTKRAGIEPQQTYQALQESREQQTYQALQESREQQTYQALQESREQQTYQALQEPREQQTYQALQESREQQTYQALQESREQQTYQALQESREQRTYQALQESREQQTYQALQESREQRTYQALQESREQQTYQALQESREQQTYQALQESREQQTYQALQEPREQWIYQALQESREQQTYQALQESREQQTYQALQESREQQTYQALQESREQQTYQALQESREQQTYQALQESREQQIHSAKLFRSLGNSRPTKLFRSLGNSRPTKLFRSLGNSGSTKLFRSLGNSRSP
ncbi:unnamed protein product [Coregonus sp. 'balchen']|nr:unnamed protein product [Coregonus sp. 'balchen']